MADSLWEKSLWCSSSILIFMSNNGATSLICCHFLLDLVLLCHLNRLSLRLTLHELLAMELFDLLLCSFAELLPFYLPRHVFLLSQRLLPCSRPNLLLYYHHLLIHFLFVAHSCQLVPFLSCIPSCYLSFILIRNLVFQIHIRLNPHYFCRTWIRNIPRGNGSRSGLLS